MRYTQLTDAHVGHMLRTIGVGSVDELFRTIPSRQRLRRELDIPRGVSEMELLADLSALAGKNADCSRLVCFLGGGAYDHFIPNIVDFLAMKGEFLTAYTPYQAEASQGSLQAFYEFQTMVCQLTGMDVANASVYELASGVAEAALMARSVTRRPGVVLSRATHPDIGKVLGTYLTDQTARLEVAPLDNGVTDVAALSRLVSQETAAVVVQSPNFLGCVERLDTIARMAHDAGALLIACVDPISCGVLKRPGDLGADIVVAEGQSLGIPMGYGGPYLGLLAAREKFLRKMPGRIVGRGQDADGRRAFCLTLQTREQHIRRENATSNICTNQGLMAMRGAVYLAAMGKSGISEVSRQCLSKAHYAAKRIAEVDGYRLRFAAPFFKEFTVQTTRGVERVLASCRTNGILAGLPLARWFEDLGDCFTVAVTEKRTRQEIDRLVEALKAA